MRVYRALFEGKLVIKEGSVLLMHGVTMKFIEPHVYILELVIYLYIATCNRQ